MDTPGQLATALREEILALEYEPDAPLREVALAARFGASRRSVREALALLEREGLVTREINRGARVRRLDAADVVDLYRVRRLLEMEGASACGDAPEEALGRVKAAFDVLAETANADQDSLSHAIADTRFHAAVIALAASPRLDQISDRILTEMTYAIRVLQRDEFEGNVDPEQVIEDHARILRPILARRPVAAAEAVEEHIDENNSRLQRLVARAPEGLAWNAVAAAQVP
jgi:DNA-binding GntR family transcriptional regulator